MNEPFGFTVGRAVKDDPVTFAPVVSDNWYVQLPHQCDAWSIAGEYYDGVPPEMAAERLERFIAEAQCALAALRRGEQFGMPEVEDEWT